MDYPRALEYLLSFADFERSGRFQDRPDVAPMLALLRRLGDPHLGRTTVHVAGSKGKGSVAAMVAAILLAAGQRTGLYTSPHLHSYCERVRLDGEPISEGDFARLTGQLRPAVQEVQSALGERRLVTFDLLTALAFLAFRRAGAVVQVLETGIGGRVDSTNVFETKDVCLITPISLEHTAVLGDTVEKIAAEKAAIIRPGCAVVLAPQDYEGAARTVHRFARAARAPLVDAAREYRWQRLSHDLRGQQLRIEGPHGALEARLPLLGAHQVENAATALAGIDALRRRGLEISAGAVSDGLSSVYWPGRLEVLRQRPLVIADGAHNRNSARRFRETFIDYFAVDRALFIIGCSADKDIRGLAEELAPLASSVLAVKADHPRAMSSAQLAAALAEAGVESQAVGGVGEALDRAMARVGEQGVICVLGSLFVVAEAREHLLAAGARHSG